MQYNIILVSFIFAAIFATIDGYQNRQTDIYRKTIDGEAENASLKWHVLNLFRNLCFILFFAHGLKEIFVSFSIFLLISDGIINVLRGYDISFVGTANNKYDTDRVWIWLKSKGINQYFVKVPVFLIALYYFI